MSAQQIRGKVMQLSRLKPWLWPQFLRDWSRHNRTGMLPCVLPRAKQLLLVPVADFYQSYAFFAEASNGCDELDFFLRRLRPGDIVYDIGAFRGVYGIAARAALGEHMRVHCFEAIPSNARRIERIIEINRLSNVRVIAAAVGAGDDITAVMDHDADMLRKGSAAENANISMSSLTLDEYVRHSGDTPAALKIDVEGFELEVLRGAMVCLRELHPRLWLEIHPQMLAARAENAQDILDLLNSVGYSTIQLYHDAKLPTGNIAFHVWCAP